MTNRLEQKHLLKGTRTFEIIDDSISVHIKTPFKKDESLTVTLSILNREPVISKSMLEFTSRVNNEALVSLFLAKPNADEFNAFVNLLKNRIQDEFSSFAGLKSAAAPGIERNVFEEPPEFDSPDTVAAAQAGGKPVSAKELRNSIQLLTAQIGTDQIGSFISALESLADDPKNAELLAGVINEFHSQGPFQGAILTYAPYITSLLSDDPFAF